MAPPPRAAATARMQRVAEHVGGPRAQAGGGGMGEVAAVSQPVPAPPPAQAPGPSGSRSFGPWPSCQLLLPEGAGRQAVLADWRRRRAAAAAAMYPAAMGHTRDETPLLWSAAEWAAAEAQQQAEPIFEAAAYEEQMAAQAGAFERDGYVVLRGVMTPAATAKWTRSLRRGQELNDLLIRCDWSGG